MFNRNWNAKIRTSPKKEHTLRSYTAFILSERYFHFVLTTYLSNICFRNTFKGYFAYFCTPILVIQTIIKHLLCLLILFLFLPIQAEEVPDSLLTESYIQHIHLRNPQRALQLLNLAEQRQLPNLPYKLQPCHPAQPLCPSLPRAVTVQTGCCLSATFQRVVRQHLYPWAEEQSVRILLFIPIAWKELQLSRIHAQSQQRKILFASSCIIIALLSIPLGIICYHWHKTRLRNRIAVKQINELLAQREELHKAFKQLETQETLRNEISFAQPDEEEKEETIWYATLYMQQEIGNLIRIFLFFVSSKMEISPCPSELQSKRNYVLIFIILP